MSALTLRLPDDKHQRLRTLAQSRGASVNRQIGTLACLFRHAFAQGKKQLCGGEISLE